MIIINIVLWIFSFSYMHTALASSSSASISSGIQQPEQPLTIRQKIEHMFKPEDSDIEITKGRYSNTLSAMEKVCLDHPDTQTYLNVWTSSSQASMRLNSSIDAYNFAASHHATPAIVQEQDQKFAAAKRKFDEMDSACTALSNKMSLEVKSECWKNFLMVARDRIHILELEKKELERKLKIQLDGWRQERKGLEKQNANLRELLARNQSTQLLAKNKPNLSIQIPESKKELGDVVPISTNN